MRCPSSPPDCSLAERLHTVTRRGAVVRGGGPCGAVPKLPVHGFIAPSAAVMGDVVIGEKSSIWYGRRTY